MQISKLFAVAGVAALCAGIFSVRAGEDTPAQAAARAALLNRLEGFEAPAAPAPAVETPVAPPPVVVLPPLENPPDTSEMTPAAVAPPVLPEANIPSANVPVAPPSMPIEAAPAVPEMPVVAPPAQPEPDVPAVSKMMPAAADEDNDAQIKAAAALQQKMEELNREKPVAPVVTVPAPVPAPVAPPMPPPAVAPVMVAPVPAKPVVVPPASASYPGRSLGLKPIEAPALPISGDKEARLQALNAQYKADQISPEEYHKQRAAILGEP